MIGVSQNILVQLSAVLNKITEEEYKSPLGVFSGASVSQHVRHILEFYICLINSTGNCVNYDDRKRDLRLEQDLSFTKSSIQEISKAIEAFTEDKEIELQAKFGTTTHVIKSSLNRELLYAIEHGVHHMAILKMGILINFPHVKIAEDFGVAESTIQYRKECAQ